MKKFPEMLKGYYLVSQISGVLLCSIFGSVFGGVWLDRRFGTTPCLMFLLLVIGISFAAYSIWQTIQEIK